MKLTLIALVALAVVGCKKSRTEEMFESRAGDARLIVQKFANEAFPQWARANPNEKCPKSIEDLTPYMDSKSGRDPWGNWIQLECNDGKVRVHSFGEDGKDGTSDDIKSWK